MSDFEVPDPILNSPFAEPARHWFIREGHSPEPREGRRPGIVFPPRDQKHDWDLSDGTLRRSQDYAGYELALVNLVRERLKAWRAAGYPGASRTTQDLLAVPEPATGICWLVGAGLACFLRRLSPRKWRHEEHVQRQE